MILWDLEQRRPPKQITIAEDAFAKVAYSENGKHVFVLAGDQASIHDPQSGQQQFATQGTGRILFAQARDEQTVAFGFSKEVVLVDLPLLRQRRRIPVSSCTVLAFSRDRMVNDFFISLGY